MIWSGISFMISLCAMNSPQKSYLRAAQTQRCFITDSVFSPFLRPLAAWLSVCSCMGLQVIATTSLSLGLGSQRTPCKEGQTWAFAMKWAP